MIEQPEFTSENASRRTVDVMELNVNNSPIISATINAAGSVSNIVSDTLDSNLRSSPSSSSRIVKLAIPGIIFDTVSGVFATESPTGSNLKATTKGATFAISPYNAGGKGQDFVVHVAAVERA